MDESREPSVLRRVDARFLLPRLPETAVVMHRAWLDGLVQAGVRIVEPGEGPMPDLVVAPARLREDALRLGAPMTMLDGRPRRGSGGGTSRVRRYLPVQTRNGAIVVADLSNRQAADRALAIGTHAGNVGTAAKRSLARAAVRYRLLPPIVPMYTLHSRVSTTTPALVREAARQVGVEVAGWFLLIEPGADDGRLAFFLFTGRDDPQMVLKFARLVDDRRRAQREARGLEAARAVGATVVAHAPQLLCEFELGGHHATVQTAAAGQALGRTVASRGARERKLMQIEMVVEWLREIARTTAHRRSSLDDDIRGVITCNSRGGDADRLLRAAGAAPAVFQHGDLGDRNVIANGDAFVAIDWELARADGFPLWDLLCLAVCTLPLLDRKVYDSGERHEDEYVRALSDLFGGRAESSGDFFRWLRSIANASGIDPAVVPEMVSLWFLWYTEQWSGWRPLERFAAEWFEDPELGTSWPLWRNSIRGSC